MSVGYANGIRVMSMTHTGEPGFMLYIPIEVSPRRKVAGFPTPAGHWQGERAGSDCAWGVEGGCIRGTRAF